MRAAVLRADSGRGIATCIREGVGYVRLGGRAEIREACACLSCFFPPPPACNPLACSLSAVNLDRGAPPRVSVTAGLASFKPWPVGGSGRGLGERRPSLTTHPLRVAPNPRVSVSPRGRQPGAHAAARRSPRLPPAFLAVALQIRFGVVGRDESAVLFSSDSWQWCH